jgi:hypothetical protein
VKIKNSRTKMILMMILLITMDLLINGKDTEILLKLGHKMIGIVILVPMITKRQETMLHHTKLVMDGLASSHSGMKTK